MSVHAIDLLRLQKAVLEGIATGADAHESLDQLCRLVEGLVSHSVCSYMRYDETTQLLDLSSASCAPDGMFEDFRAVPVSDVLGSCAAAVLSQAPVYVGDTATDPRWAKVRAAAESYGIMACWSHPIHSKSGGLLGTFAISRGIEGQPDEFHRSVLETAAHLAGIALDRERDEETQRQLDQKMQQAQKLESLGVLAGGIAHDFNNLLVGVLGNADLARAEVPPDSRLAEQLNSIVESSKTAADLCRQMLAYAGKGQLRVGPADLNSLVRDSTRLLAASLPKEVELELTLARELPAIEADSTQLRQIIMNLVTNGGEAIVAGPGEVHLETGVVDLGSEDLPQLLLAESLEPGEFVYLQVTDTGCGMDDETCARIFDPFYSTKFAGRGLGLAAVQGIVRGHGGALEVVSGLDEGTRIRVLFPPMAERVAEDDRPAPPEVPEASGTVLFADDDRVVRDVGRAMLEGAGFRVHTVEDGDECLAFYADQHERIDCVVLDLAMPKLSAKDVVARLRRLRADVPVVVTSGYTQEEASSFFSGCDVAAFVAKPFDRASLVRAVQAAQRSLSARG